MTLIYSRRTHMHTVVVAWHNNVPCVQQSVGFKSKPKIHVLALLEVEGKYSWLSVGSLLALHGTWMTTLGLNQTLTKEVVEGNTHISQL